MHYFTKICEFGKIVHIFDPLISKEVQGFGWWGLAPKNIDTEVNFKAVVFSFITICSYFALLPPATARLYIL